ncbi:MAG: nicotinamide mononucleotide transporter [Flavobacteriales bacterium]|nr:nicotinamide mononucleotide transporter [Flavobacteriales bacterium]
MSISLDIVEWTAVLLNITYVVLAWYQKKACWIFGGLGSALSVYYFQHDAIRLYSEAGLYLFYVFVAIYGWWVWNRPDARPIHELEIKTHLSIILAGFLLATLLSSITSNYTDAARPFADSLSTVFGILATFLTIRKVLSNWIYWIIIDIFSIWLYISRESEVYALQMFLFAILALIGYLQWRKEYRIQDNA